jgi:hypothetical protein
MTKPRKVLLAALLALLAGPRVDADARCATTSHHRQNQLVRLRGHPNSPAKPPALPERIEEVTQLRE